MAQAAETACVFAIVVVVVPVPPPGRVVEVGRLVVVGVDVVGAGRVVVGTVDWGIVVGYVVVGGNVVVGDVVVVVVVVASRALRFSFFRRAMTSSAAFSEVSVMPPRRVSMLERRSSLVRIWLVSTSCGLSQQHPTGTALVDRHGVAVQADEVLTTGRTR